MTHDVHIADGFTQGYRNRFTATPWDVPFRPPLAHPKPRVLGSQTAVVTGPAGEEIHCDEYGRIKVQFHWDRHGQADDTTSCWLRASTRKGDNQKSRKGDRFIFGSINFARQINLSPFPSSPFPSCPLFPGPLFPAVTPNGSA